VPADVAVIGWDAIDLTASTVPSITTVAPDTHALASHALDLLLERMARNSTRGDAEARAVTRVAVRAGGT
jgi:DNA-binding LacI/PurR family transcriptional regulator